jgi:hypothetical protein
VGTAASELAGTSKTAQYGPPYNHGTGFLQQFYGVSVQHAIGVTDPIDPARAFLLAQLGTVISLGAQTLTRDNLNQFFTSALDMAQETSFAEVLRASFQDAARESARESEHLGGFMGLLRVMNDKEVQTGLRMMGVMAGKLSPLLHPHPAPANDR